MWAPGLRFPRTEGRLEKGRGLGECPSVVSRSASVTWAGKFGAGCLSLHYREMGSLGRCGRKTEVETWGSERVLQLKEGETGAVRQKEGPQSLHLLGAWGGGGGAG